MPEIIDRVSAAGVANRISQFLDQPEALQEKGLRLRQAYLDLAGASARMLDALV
jgi:hypothetical protein